jgi:hypothetical protein
MGERYRLREEAMNLLALLFLLALSSFLSKVQETNHAH